MVPLQQHHLPSWALVLSQEALLFACGYSFAGPLLGALLLLGSVLLASTVGRSGQLTQRWLRAIPLPYAMAPTLHEATVRLAQRARIHQPQLLLLPLDQPNALTLPGTERSSVALSSGLLQLLDQHEQIAVLAHEIAHIQQDDLSLLALTRAIMMQLQLLAQLTFWLVLLTLPLQLFGTVELNLMAALLLLVAPGFCGLLAAALSRQRELQADRQAVELCGDPFALAQALQKIEWQQARSWLGYWRWRHNWSEDLYRSHPPTAQRLRQLYELQRYYR